MSFVRVGSATLALIARLVLNLLWCMTVCLNAFADQPELMALRRRWWRHAAAHLAVSSATAEDLARLLQKPDLQPHWCHLAPADAFRGDR